MKIKEDDVKLTIQDNPGFSWLVAALIMAVGGLAAAGPLGLFSTADDLSIGLRTLVFILGVGVIVAGGLILRVGPLSTSVVDRKTKQVTIARRNLFGGSSAQIAFSDIAGIEISQQNKPDGKPVFQIQLVLSNGKIVPVSILGESDRQGCERTVAELKAWIRA